MLVTVGNTRRQEHPLASAPFSSARRKLFIFPIPKQPTKGLIQLTLKSYTAYCPRLAEACHDRSHLGGANASKRNEKDKIGSDYNQKGSEQNTCDLL